MKATLLLFGLFLVGGDAGQDAAKKDMTALEGAWVMVSGTADGSPMPSEMVKTARRVAKDGETTVTINGEVFIKAKFTIDATKKPKTIDYQMLEGVTKGKKQLGIYEIEGDTVKFCFAGPEKDRPTDFTAKDGSGRTLGVWKREKAKDEKK